MARVTVYLVVKLEVDSWTSKSNFSAVSHFTKLPPHLKRFIKLLTEAVNIRVQLSFKDLSVR